MEAVVILGNGFDLNLGLRSGYADFLDSSYARKLIDNKNNYLSNRIFNNYILQNWSDLEAELKSFAREFNDIDTKHAKEFRSQYNSLIDALQSYLQEEQSNVRQSVLKNSLAAKFLKLISDNPLNFKVFSYNYTNLETFTGILGLTSFPYHHVHGKLSGNHKHEESGKEYMLSANRNSMILGFEDNVEDIDRFSYMIKSFNRDYTSHNVRGVLSECKHLIIFGHSLGATDYQYFHKFFKEKSSPDMKPEESVRIDIITADEGSKQNILNRIRLMNDNNSNVFMDQNDVHFYYTMDYKSQVLFKNLCDQLKCGIELEKAIYKRSSRHLF